MPHVELSGVRLYYEDEGHGDVVMFVAGLMGGVENWRLQTQELASEFRCITLDNRGVGHSSKPDTPYSIEMFGEDVVALLDHLDVDRVHLVGSSMGGMIAQYVAVNHPARIRTLSLHCTAPESDHYIRRISELYIELSQSLEVVDRLWVDLFCFSHDTYNARRDEIAALEAEFRTRPMPAHAFRRQLEALANHRLIHRLAEIDKPTLIGCGSEDAWMPVSAAKTMGALIDGAEVEIFEGMGHLYKWEDPQRFNRLQRDFLRRHGPARDE